MKWLEIYTMIWDLDQCKYSIFLINLLINLARDRGEIELYIGEIHQFNGYCLMSSDPCNLALAKVHSPQDYIYLTRMAEQW